MTEFLADRQLDVLTNSIPVLSRLHETSRNRVSVPGGTIFREQNIVISPFEDDTVDSFWAQKLFTGCYGINRHGVMEADPLIVQAQARLLKRAERVIVLADSHKLRQRSPIIVLPLEKVSALITDDAARDEELDELRDAGIKIIIAPLTDADRRQVA
jgi:DeoR family ulaG and ulaABCDEF operon transcriptional repressor